MNIEIDQSGKIEQLNKNTVIAFSNKNQYCILMPKNLKQSIILQFKGKIKSLRYKLFCIGVYYCIKDYIQNQELITICTEYKGKEHLIKSILLSFLSKNRLNIDHRIIKFEAVGKQSNAHAVAIDVFRKYRKPNKILTKKEVIELLK